MATRLWVAWLLMVPVACGDGSGGPTGNAAVWVSEDGTTWERIVGSELGGPGDQQMLGVTQLGDALVAVGLHRSDGEMRGRVWVSADGRTWRSVDQPSLAGPGETLISRVAVTPAGLVAIGITGGPEETDPAVWISPDGEAWTRVEHANLSSKQPAGASSIVVLGDLILVGGWLGDRASVWTTSDGLDWTAEVIQSSGAEPAAIHDMVVAGGRVIAVGRAGTDAGAWTTDDGVDWDPVPEPSLGGPGVQSISSATMAGGRLVAVGIEETYERIYFLGRGADSRFSAAVWLSPDGRTWERVPDPSRPGGVGDELMYRVVGWGDRLVATGTANPDPRQAMSGEFDTGADFDAAIWISDSGLVWTRVQAPSLGGPDWQDIFDVVVFGGELVAVGGDDLGSP